MTETIRDRAFRIGGFAALVAAAAIPVKIVATLIELKTVTAGGLPKLALFVEAVEFGALVLVAFTLRRWMGEISRPLALLMLGAGVAGFAVGALANLVLVAGAPMSDDLDTATSFVAAAGAAIWLLVGGTLIGRDDSQVPKLGWIGQVGGFGLLISAVEVVLPPEMQARLASGNLPLFVLLAGIFVLLYLVRLGRFMAFGHIPTGRI